ncbi:antA/AntB antirepressor family protein [uncultured Draconibacterium sp.]|uniref:antA/AntB antirepressor family protein n=1 Tax=uncultured Draconibacterium sp. TaxID=1573823 RepID=UPI0032615937
MEKKNKLVIASNGDNILIDAKLLHQQLQVSTRFNDWIQRRIKEFGFEEDKDFYSILSNQKFLGWGGNRRSIDYHLTMDMAKELAMIERNDVGRQVRRYFIAVEKEMREAYKTGRILPKGVKSRSINGRKLYPYKRMAEKLGYKPGGSLYYRRNHYPNHFVKLDRLWYCTEEMANLLAMQRSAVVHRENIRHMQPILPLGFGEPLKIGGAL